MLSSGSAGFDVRGASGGASTRISVRSGRFRLAAAHYQLAAAGCRQSSRNETVTSQNLPQAGARVMRDVLIAVTTGHQEAIDRLDGAPSDGVVVRRPDYKHPAGAQHPSHLGEKDFVERNVLDHLR